MRNDEAHAIKNSLLELDFEDVCDQSYFDHDKIIDILEILTQFEEVISHFRTATHRSVQDEEEYLAPLIAKQDDCNSFLISLGNEQTENSPENKLSTGNSLSTRPKETTTSRPGPMHLPNNKDDLARLIEKTNNLLFKQEGYYPTVHDLWESAQNNAATFGVKFDESLQEYIADSGRKISRRAFQRRCRNYLKAAK